MLALSNAIKKSWLVAGCIGALAVVFFLSFIESKNSSIQSLNKFIDTASPELSISMMKSDLKTIEMLLRPLPGDDISFIQVNSVDAELISLPEVVKPTVCYVQSKKEVKYYGMAVGNINTCYSLPYLLLEAVESPLFVSATCIIITLVVLLPILSLFGYKKELLGVLRFLESWSHDQDSNIRTFLGSNKNRDKISAKIVELFEKGVVERINIIENGKRNEIIAKTTQNISHDLKAPIGVLANVLNLQSWREIEAALPAYKSALFKLQMMVTSLKDADVGNIVRADWTSFSLRKLVEELKIPNKGVNIVLSESYPDKVKMDESKIERAIANLILNAIEAGAQNIGVSGSCCGMDLAFKVEDDGPGVPEEFVPSLFSRGKTYQKQGGTGLGLHSVKETANGHGGDVTYERIDGRSVFEIGLPNATMGDQNMGEVMPTEIKMEQIGAVQQSDKAVTPVSEKEIYRKVTLKLADSQLQAKVTEELSKQYPTVVINDSLEGSSFVWTSSHELVREAISRRVPIHMLSDRDTFEAITKTISNKLQYFT